MGSQNHGFRNTREIGKKVAPEIGPEIGPAEKMEEK